MTGSSSRSSAPVARTEPTGALREPVDDGDARVVLRVTRTGSDGTVEQATAVRVPTGEVVVGVDGHERPQRYESLEAAIRSEVVLRVVDERDTSFSTPVLRPWQLADLLEGDGAEINGTSWFLEEDGSWWPDDVWDDPDHDDDAASAIFKVPGAGGMTGGPVSAIRLQCLGDRYWWHDWEREYHDRTRSSTPQEALRWFANGLDGKIVSFSSPRLDGWDDETIAELLPGNGPALWVNGELWQRQDRSWERRSAATPTDAAEVKLSRIELCQHTGPGSDAYRWLGLDLTPTRDTDLEPSWWCVLIADPDPDAALLAFLADAVFGSTENPTPNHPPTVLAYLGDGTRWIGLGAGEASVAEKLAGTTPAAVRVAGHAQAVWLLDGDGQPTGPTWTYQVAEIEPPPGSDMLPLVDPTW